MIVLVYSIFKPIFQYLVNLVKVKVKITHTITSAFCPFADQIVQDIHAAGLKNTGATHVEVITTFDPPFTMDSVSEETKLMMGW